MNAIQVTTAMSFGSRLYGFNAMGGQYGITTGMIMIPFLIGVGVAFYDYKKVWGWLLAGVSLASMIIGVITSVRFVIRPMSSFEFIVILVLVVGGIGLMIGKKKSTPQD